MNDLTSLLFYVIVGVVWVLTSIFGDRAGRGRRREWEFPEPRKHDPDSPAKRPPIERIPAKWRGQQPTPAQPTTATNARRSVAATLAAIAQTQHVAPPQTAEPAPLTEEPAPFFTHSDDLERAVILSTILDPPVALRSRGGQRRFARASPV